MARSILLLVSAASGPEKFEAAEVAYDLGHFERAQKLYVEAYELDPRPGLLFNIGQCHRKLGQWSQAAFFYRRYLARVPQGEGVAQLHELIAEMDARSVARPPPAPKKVALAVAASPAAVTPPAAVTAEEDPVYKQWWLWTAAGAATTLTVAAAVAVGVAASQSQPQAGGAGPRDRRDRR